MPTSTASGFLAAVLLLCLAGTVCTGLYGYVIYPAQGEGTSAGYNSASVTATILGLLVLMPLALVLAFAGIFRERRSFSRTLLLLGAGLFWLAGSLSGIYGYHLISDSPAIEQMMLYLICCLPPNLLLLALVVYFAFNIRLEIKRELAVAREVRAAQMIEACGEVTLRELAAELGLPEAQGAVVVDGALQAGRFHGLHDAKSGRVYSYAALRAKQKQLVAVVVSHGQIGLEELAAELRAPRELLRDWVYQIVRRGEFSGYINWEEGIIYSAEAQKLTAADRCPHCGGELALAGKGVIRCDYCGSEIFI